MEPIKTVKGTNGQLSLFEDKIRIARKGFFGLTLHGLKGDKEIYLTQIASIQFKKAGMVAGYIQFAFVGGQEAKGGLWQGISDENTITFNTKKKSKEFEDMKALIEQQIAKVKGGAASQGRAGGVDDLKALKQLKDEGVITEEEFAQKKKQILEI
jgi:hypothetical protein